MLGRRLFRVTEDRSSEYFMLKGKVVELPGGLFGVMYKNVHNYFEIDVINELHKDWHETAEGAAKVHLNREYESYQRRIKPLAHLGAK